MTEFTTNGLTMFTGVELPNGMVAVATTHPDYDPVEQPHTVVIYRAPESLDWEAGGFISRGTASAAPNASNDAVLFIDENGTVGQFQPGVGSRFEIRKPDPRYLGRAIRFLKNIDGQLWAGGAGHTLHLAEPGGAWSEVTTEAMEQTPNPRGFEAAAGFSRDEVYFVGWNGSIWSRIGGTWSQIESPTNLLLSCVGVGDDRVFAGGKVGTILEGRGDDWRILEHDLTDHQLFDIVTFNGATYFSGFFGLLKLEDGVLEEEWIIGGEFETAGTMFVGPSGLWSVGSTTLALNDGSGWQTVLQT